MCQTNPSPQLMNNDRPLYIRDQCARQAASADDVESTLSMYIRVATTSEAQNRRGITH